MNAKEVKALLENPVAFHPVFARIAGSASAGLMLSQAFFWSRWVEDKYPGRDGWFYKSQAEWEDDVCLTRWEQETARKSLRKFPFWQEKRRGSPAKLWFRLDFDKLGQAISQYVGKPHSRMRETNSLECGKTSDKSVGKPQSLKGTESTAEITSETTPAGDDFHVPPYKNFTKDFPRLTQVQFDFAVRQIRARSTTPPRSVEFWRKSLKRFFEHFAEEAQDFLTDESYSLLGEEIGWGEVSAELKDTAAANGLPYAGALIDRAIENARSRLERQQALDRDLRIGKLHRPEVAAD